MLKMDSIDIPASRREVDQLREELHRLDDHGSRGVGTLQSQVTDLIKDLTELKADVNNRFEKHEKEHQDEKQNRIIARRWLAGFAITLIVALLAVIGLLLQIYAEIRK